MARARAIVGILIASLLISVVPLPLPSIARHAIPLVVAAADDDLALLPPAGWSVTQSAANDGNDATSVDLNEGFCHPNCGVTLTFTPTSGTFPAIGSFRVLWSQQSSFGSYISHIQLTCAGTVLYQQDGHFADNTFDTGRIAVTGTMSAQTTSFSCTWLMVSAFSAGGLHVFTISLWQAGPPGSAGPGEQGSYPGIALTPDPINIATGNFLNHATDLSMPGRVLGLDFTRSYNSADSTIGPLGPGWTHSYNWSLSDAGATVSVRRADGRVLRYTRNADLTYSPPLGVFDALVKNGDGTFTFTLTNQVAYSFSSAGALTQIGEPAGNHLAFSYSAGNLTTITDTVGRTVSLSYDGSNRLTQIQDPLGRKVTYAYDGSGRLATVTDKIGNATGQNPLQHQWKYAYDGASSHLTTISDPDARVRVTNTYDAQGRVYQQRDALSQLTSLAYSAGQTVVTDPRGNPTTYVFDGHFRELSESISVGGATKTLSYAYDSAGNRASITDRNGKITDFTYDPQGNLLTKTDPQVGTSPRYVTSFQYDSKNNLTLITDARGMTTTMTYDPTTNVLTSVARQIDAGSSATTKYEYTDGANPGMPTRVIAPRGNTTGIPNYTYSTSLTYDSQGNLVTQIDADNAKTTFGYDAAGRLQSSVDPDGNVVGGTRSQHTWSAALDENDRLTSATDPLGNALHYSYDGSGDRLTSTDRDGNITTYTYDGNARLATVVQKPDPVGQPTLTYTTSVTRDGNGNAAHVTQANSVVTDYAFDELNRLTSTTTHPDASTMLTTSYVLDGNGNPLTRTTGDGVVVTYGYDEMSRLTSVSAATLATITYGYDELSRRTQMVDATGTTTYQYDGMSRPTQVAAPNGSITYAYDLDGNRTTLGYPGSQNVTYAYTPGGRLDTVMDWASRVSVYTYQASGLVSSLAYPDGMRASYTYDRAQRLTQLVNAVGQTTITSDAYTLDAEGNRTRTDEVAAQAGASSPSAWGDNTFGQIGDGTMTSPRNPPVAISAFGTPIALATGTNHSLAVRADGTAWGWGYNQYGQVGDGTSGSSNSPRRSPVQVVGGASGSPFLQGITAVAGGLRQSLALRGDGTVWAWGYNVDGELGDGTSGNQQSPKPAPVQVVGGATGAPTLQNIVQISAGGLTSYALRSDGTVWAWGYNFSGETGDGTFGNSNKVRATPVQVKRSGGAALTGIKSISAGRSHALALATDGTVWAWGFNANGELGQGNTTSPQPSAVQVKSSDGVTPLSGVQAVAAGNGISFALMNDGTVRGWGYNGYGDLGDGTTTSPRSLPVTTSGLTGVVAIAGGGDHGLALLPDGTVRAWGRNDSGQLGAVTTTTCLNNIPCSKTPVQVRTVSGVTKVATENNHSLSIGTATTSLTYTYDGLNRLSTVSGPAAETFSFDAASNISSRTGPSATNTYDTANRQTSDGTKTFVWDGADRLVTRGTDTFSYDPLSRLTSATVGGATRGFTYNGDGLLATRPEGAVLWDRSVSPAPLLQSATDKVIYGLGPLYIARAGGTTLTLARDGLGSVRSEVSDSSVVTKSFGYNAYGQINTAPSGGPTLLGYAGELVDASGLIYLRARWYDSATSRFLSKDPYPGRACTPPTLGGYLYGNGRPTTLTDPAGFDPGGTCDKMLAQINFLMAGLGRQWWEFLTGPKPPMSGTPEGHFDHFEGVRKGLSNELNRYSDPSNGCDQSKLPSSVADALTMPNPWKRVVQTPTGDPAAPFTVTPPDTATTILIVDLGALLFGTLMLRGGGGGMGLISVE